MVTTDRVTEIFADARFMYAQAVERLEQGDVRDAAEKAWCSTKRATEGLILAKTGREPQTPAQTTGGLRSLAFKDPGFQPLRAHYSISVKDLHSDCFYDGHCEPAEELAVIIKEGEKYIADAWRLVEEDGG